MNKYTKSNPGCYHSMIKYLAELEETDSRKLLEITPEVNSKTIGGIRSYNKTVHIDGKEIKGYVKKEKITGGIDVISVYTNEPFKSPERIIFSIDTPYKEMVTVWKSLKDFKTKPESAGQYKDDYGAYQGYCMVPMYRINDKYFAMMECTCLL